MNILIVVNNFEVFLKIKDSLVESNAIKKIKNLHTISLPNFMQYTTPFNLHNMFFRYNMIFFINYPNSVNFYNDVITEKIIAEKYQRFSMDIYFWKDGRLLSAKAE